MENALVHQKDSIVRLINDGLYEEALVLIDFSAELWASVGYDYKTREIRQRIAQEVREQLQKPLHYKTEEKLQRLLDKVR